MFPGDTSLEGTEDPALEQRRSSMNGGHQHVRRITFGREVRDLVVKAQLLQSLITPPSIRMDRTTLGDHIGDEALQDGSRQIRHPTQSNSSNLGAIYLSGNSHNGFADGFPALYSCFSATNVTLINFNKASEWLSIRSDHGTAKLMKPDPSRLVTSQAEYPLQAESIGTVFLTGDLPGCKEP